MKTPDYRTIVDFNYIDPKDEWTERMLPKGTYVTPIAIYWLPTHILKSRMYRWFNDEKEIFVHSPVGIIVVDKKILRKV